MAWYDSLLSGANTLGNLYNTFQPFIQTGASVYNRNQQNNAIGDAVGVINQAGQQNQNTLRSVYDQGMGMVQPYNQAGTQALSSYQNLLSNPNQITNDPGYQFRVQQGNQAVTRNAAANRMLGSGNFATALQDYGQKSATSELDSALNRQIPLMNSGLSSINTAADLGRNFAYGTVGVNQAMADATAGGMLGRSASNTGMLSDLFGIGDQNRTNQPSNPLGQVGTAANQVVNGSGGSLGNLSNSLSNLFGGGNAAPLAAAGLGGTGLAGLGTTAGTAAALGTGGFGAGLGAAGLGGTGLGGAATLPGMGGTTAAFEGMTSGIGAGVGTGGSTAAASGATAGSIGLLGSLGIGAGIIGIGKALQNIKGGAAEEAKTGKLYKDLQALSAADPTGQSMYARVDDLVENRLWPNEGNGWVIGDLINNNVISVDYPKLHSSQSVVDLWNITPDMVEDNGAALRAEISKGDDRYWDRATGRQSKETQTLVNSTSVGPKAIAATYGLSPEQQQQYANLLDEYKKAMEYQYDSANASERGTAERIKASATTALESFEAQYMTEDRKRLYAESLYDQLRSQGYTGDLSKLERYLGVA